MKHRFKRGEIVRARCDYIPSGCPVLTLGKTYVVNDRLKTEHGHCYINILGDHGRGILLDDDLFSKVKHARRI